MRNGLPFPVLLVDDDEDDRDIIDAAFKEVGYETEIKKFIEGKALLRYLEQIDPSVYPSLIVLDNTLPGLNAQNLITLLKEDERYKKIPVIVYTTSASDMQKKQLITTGASECIEKGATFQNVVIIAEHLKRIAESVKNQTH